MTIKTRQSTYCFMKSAAGQMVCNVWDTKYLYYSSVVVAVGVAVVVVVVVSVAKDY